MLNRLRDVFSSFQKHKVRYIIMRLLTMDDQEPPH